MSNLHRVAVNSLWKYKKALELLKTASVKMDALREAGIGYEKFQRYNEFHTENGENFDITLIQIKRDYVQRNPKKYDDVDIRQFFELTRHQQILSGHWNGRNKLKLAYRHEV